MDESSNNISSVFKIPRKHVIGEIFFVLLTTFVLLGLGILVAFACCCIFDSVIPDLDFFGHPQAILSVTLPILMLFLYLIWKTAKERLKFTLHAGPQSITFGKWPFRETIDCLDVKTIRETANFVSYSIEISASTKSWKLFFGSLCPSCITSLRAICPNAIFLDARGIEHLPSSPHTSQTVIQNLIKTRRKRAKKALLVSVLCWIGSVLILVTFFTATEDRTTLQTLQLLPYSVIPLLGILTLHESIMQFRKANALSTMGSETNSAP